MIYGSTLKRKTPLKSKTPLRAKTPLKAKTQLKARTSLKTYSCISAADSTKPRKSSSQKKRKVKEPFESIFTDNLERCFITGCYEGIYDGEYHEVHIHHIFGAANKHNSEKYHFLIPLRDDYHNKSSDKAVHRNRDFDLRLKRICQTYWLLCYGDEEEFIKTFGKWW